MSAQGGAGTQALTCREVVELVTDYLEGALSDGIRSQFEVHLARCKPCVDYVDQIRATAALASAIEPPALDRETTRRLVELYRAWQEP